MTVERDLSPVTGDLDEEGMVDLRKVFPRAIARIEQEAAALERRKMVERIGEEINHHELDYEDDGYVLIGRERLRAILSSEHAILDALAAEPEPQR